MIDTNTNAICVPQKSQEQPKLTRSQKRKRFVYIPEDQGQKEMETQIQVQVKQEKNPNNSVSIKKQEDVKPASSNNAELETNSKTAKKKQNKKKFVYTPQKEDEKKSTEAQPTIKNDIPAGTTITEKQESNFINQAEKNNKVNNKNNNKKYVYKPENQENNRLKDNNNQNKDQNCNNKQNHKKENNNRNNNYNKKNNNNNNNNKSKNNNNNIKVNIQDNNSNNKKLNNNQFNEMKKKEIHPKINFNNNKNDQKKDESLVNYSTYIELDMHGSDPRAKRPLDWVPVIRDALFSALERNVDAVRFIPGKGLHSNPEIGPVLRILVILTAKRLGFESSFNPNNEGVIICKVSSHSNSTSFLPHMPNKDEQDDLNRNETLLKAFGLGKDGNLNIDNLSFRAVKNRFPHMPTICIAIICVKRNPKEALEFAQLFEDRLIADDVFQQQTEDEKKNEQLLNEISMIDYLEEKYGLDHEVIERVVREKKMKNKSQIILDRIENEIPENFYNYLTEFLLNFSHIPIESLLDSMKEGLYNPNEITQILNSKSWRGMQNALSVMKVQNQITTDRTDGRPKFIPSIEIDLANVSADNAKKTMDKIMNGLGNGNFSEMVLILAPQNQKSRKCSIDDVNAFLYNKASQEGFHIVRTRKADEKNNRYHFMVFNKKEEI